MPRVLSAALLLVLLGATAIAFAVTEGLKLEPSPVSAVSVDKVVSPTCGCPTAHATIRFRLRKADHVTVAIVDAGERAVRTLVDSRPTKKGIVRLTWDGRGGGGGAVPDGLYRPRIHLRSQHKTIVLPNPIRVDTAPPSFKSVHVRPGVLRPGKHVAVVYRLSEPAHAIVYVNGKRVLVGRSVQTSWKLDWYGRGEAPGVYRFAVAARDVAGNVSARRAVGTVLIPVHLVAQRVRVAAGARFAVRVAANGLAYRWRLGGRTGKSRGKVLHLVAPSVPGRYTLVLVQAHVTSARPVFVRAK